MNRKYFLIFIVFFFLSNTNLYSQNRELSVGDAIVYLENVLNSDLVNQENIYGGKKIIKIEVIENEVFIKYFWKDYKDAINYEFQNTDINYNEIIFNVADISNVFLKMYNSKYSVVVQCKDKTKNCFYINEEAIKPNFSNEFVDKPKAVNHYNYLHLFYLGNEVSQKKVYNSLNYILYEIERKDRELVLIDPFSNNKKKTRKETINLTKKGGVFSLDINLGGIESNVLLDSGASDVSIPESFVNKLLEQGLISEKDFLTPGLYTIADGSVVKNKRFIIPYIKVNDVIVKNVRCSVNKSKNVFLLGKAFLDRFISWKINNETKQLILEL